MGIVIDSQLRSMKQWIVAAVVACVFAAAWAADFSDEEEGPGAQEKLLVAVKSTTTVWSVSVTSTTIPQICVNSYSTATTCSGRRRRRAIQILEEAYPEAEAAAPAAVELDASLNDADTKVAEPEASEKLLLTLWKTLTSTTTSTSLTLDYLCSTTSINSIYPSC